MWKPLKASGRSIIITKRTLRTDKTTTKMKLYALMIWSPDAGWTEAPVLRKALPEIKLDMFMPSSAFFSLFLGDTAGRIMLSHLKWNANGSVEVQISFENEIKPAINSKQVQIYFFPPKNICSSSHAGWSLPLSQIHLPDYLGWLEGASSR